MGWTYGYVLQRHGWAGLDGEDSRIFGVVNDFSVLPTNAVSAPAPFGPDGKGFLAYGDTEDGTPLAVLDVVAHKFMHGVTSFSADLRSVPIADGLGPDRIVLENGVFSCEDMTQTLSDGTTVPYFCVDGRFARASNHGGAINEAFSDVFGTGVEFFVQEPGSGPLRADYESGEDLPLLGPIRSLASPQSLRIAGPVSYPDHFGRRLRFGTVVVEGTRAAPTRLALYPLIFLDD